MKTIDAKDAKGHFACLVQRDQHGINRNTLDPTQNSILEQFSNDCLKTKTEVITLTNLNAQEQTAPWTNQNS